MSRDGKIWTLHHDDRVIGRIIIDGSDFPWLEGAFAPLEGFARFKPLFERSLELLDAEAHDEWEVLYNRIADQLELRSPDGPVPEFLLHIQDDRAWFRWSETPFG